MNVILGTKAQERKLLSRENVGGELTEKTPKLLSLRYTCVQKNSKLTFKLLTNCDKKYAVLIKSQVQGCFNLCRNHATSGQRFYPAGHRHHSPSYVHAAEDDGEEGRGEINLVQEPVPLNLKEQR